MFVYLCILFRKVVYTFLWSYISMENKIYATEATITIIRGEIYTSHLISASFNITST